MKNYKFESKMQMKTLANQNEMNNKLARELFDEAIKKLLSERKCRIILLNRAINVYCNGATFEVAVVCKDVDCEQLYIADSCEEIYVNTTRLDANSLYRIMAEIEKIDFDMQ